MPAFSNNRTNRRWFGPFYIRQRLRHVPPMFRGGRETAAPFREAQPVFIVGGGRSGNTLLRAMLTASDQLVIPPESYVLPEVIRKFREFAFLPWDELVRLLLAEFAAHPDFGDWGIGLGCAYERAVAVPKEHRSLAAIIDALYTAYSIEVAGEVRRWGDKTPRNYVALQWIDRVFPNARYVHVLREGRDVVCSTLKAGIYETAEDAARRWVTAVRSCQRFGRKVPAERFLEVRYEDLVTTPAAVARRLSDFLGLEYSDSMLEYHQRGGYLGDNHRSHHQNVSKPISTSSIGKGQRELTPDELERIRPIIRDEMQWLGYN